MTSSYLNTNASYAKIVSLGNLKSRFFEHVKHSAGSIAPRVQSGPTVFSCFLLGSLVFSRGSRVGSSYRFGKQNELVVLSGIRSDGSSRFSRFAYLWAVYG